MKRVIGVDQYGQHYTDLGRFPRKALLEQLYSSNAQKMYIDDKDGEARHIGYIIAGLWISLYFIEEWKKEVAVENK